MDASHRHRPPRVIVPSDPSSEHRRASSGWGQIREAFSEFRPTLGEALRARVLYPLQPSFSLPKAPVVLIMRQHVSDVDLVSTRSMLSMTELWLDEPGHAGGGAGGHQPQRIQARGGGE